MVPPVVGADLAEADLGQEALLTVALDQQLASLGVALLQDSIGSDVLWWRDEDAVACPERPAITEPYGGTSIAVEALPILRVQRLGTVGKRLPCPGNTNKKPHEVATRAQRSSSFRCAGRYGTPVISSNARYEAIHIASC